jgi:hypothetical protein
MPKQLGPLPEVPAEPFVLRSRGGGDSCREDPAAMPENGANVNDDHPLAQE